MRFPSSTIILCTSLLAPLMGAALRTITVSASVASGPHHLEVQDVKGARTRLTFEWDAGKGFRLTGTNELEPDQGWGWGIGAFNYVKNDERVVCNFEGAPKKDDDIHWAFQAAPNENSGRCKSPNNGFKLICSSQQECSKANDGAE